jgi:CHASE3 domain sensor protein
VTFTPVQKLSITSGAAMIMLSAVGLVSYLSTTQMQEAQQAAAVTNANIARLDLVLVRTMAAEAAARAYVMRGSAAALAEVDSAQSDVEYALDSIRAATEDQPSQRRNLDSLGPIVSSHFETVRRVVATRKRSGREAAVQLLAQQPARVSPARLLATMRNEEVLLLGERTRAMVAGGKATRGFIVAGSIFALVLALLALQPLRPSVERRLTQRLSRTMSAVPDEDLHG